MGGARSRGVKKVGFVPVVVGDLANIDSQENTLVGRKRSPMRRYSL